MGQFNSTTSIHHAVQQGNNKQLRYLLKKRRQTNINEKCHEKTALFLAVTEEEDQAVDLLLQYGADPNIICLVEKYSWLFKWSVIHEACWQGNTASVQQLLDHSGDVNLEAHHKMSPLHVAAWFGHKEVVKILIDNGCDVNHLDRFKESAIVMPVCQGDYDTVRILLMAGCKLNSRCWANIRKIQGKYDLEFRDQIYTRHGPFSLFSLAIKYAWLRIAILLLQHGFNPNKYSILDIMEDLKSNMGVIDNEGRRLIECFLSSGYKFRASDERELSYLATICEDKTPRNLESGENSPDPAASSSRSEILDVISMEVSAVSQQSNSHNIPLITFNPDPRVQCLSSVVDRDFTQWLQDQSGLRHPVLLKQACRNIIRMCLRVAIQQASIVPSVLKLQLPKLLKDYLMLSEFGDPLEESQFKSPYFQGYLDTEKLYFAMPRRVKHRHVYRQFWTYSCCCAKW